MNDKRTRTTRATTIWLVAAAMAAAFVSAKWLPQGNPLVSIPWGILAFLAAFAATSRRQALTWGGAVGFVSAYAYLWFDHSGGFTLTKVLFMVIAVVLPALFGMLCGAACAWVGWALRRHLPKRK